MQAQSVSSPHPRKQAPPALNKRARLCRGPRPPTHERQLQGLAPVPPLHLSGPACRLTSTQVSISGNWLMMGSTASMELPGRKSDLLPTKMMGTLGRGPQSPGLGELVETRTPQDPARYLGPFSAPPFTSGIHLVRI